MRKFNPECLSHTGNGIMLCKLHISRLISGVLRYILHGPARLKFLWNHDVGEPDDGCCEIGVSRILNIEERSGFFNEMANFH